MKKIAIFLCLTAFLLVGCEKKQPELPPVSGNLTIWVSENGDFWEALGREFISLFDSSDLQFRVIAFESDTELKKTLPDAILEGNGPDIVFVDGDWIAHNVGKLVPLRDDEALQPEKFKEYFTPSVARELIHGGVIWGVPMGIETLAVIYNAGHFEEEFGADVKVGETWEDFRDQAEALNRKNNSFERFARSGGAIGRVDNIIRGKEIFFELFLQLTGELFSDDGSEALFAETKGVTSSGERVNYALQALKFYLGFANEGVSYHSWNALFVSPESKHKDFEAFAKGNVSMVFGTPRDLKYIESLFDSLPQGKRIPQNDIRVGFLPQFESPEKTSLRKVYGSVNALAVPVSSRDQQLAWQFLKFSLRTENLHGFFKSTGIPSPRQNLLQQEETEPNREIFVRQAKVAQGMIFPLSREIILSGMKKLVHRTGEKILTPEEGLKEMEDTFNHMLKRRRILQEAFSPPQQ
jgi:ABC-type glycerol-3-phosphate transport system substrate-binding protein